MPTTPVISVVIPLYNKAGTILRTLRGALAQSFADIEVIVVDDGSTDGGGALARSVEDDRLSVIGQANAGVSAARNRAILAARGEWIALLDADDDWDPAHLERLHEAALEADVATAFANVRLETRPERPMIDPAAPAKVIDDYFSFALAHGGYPNMTSAMLIRRDAAIAAGLFTVGLRLGEDIDLWGRLALRGPMLYSGACTVTYNDAPRPGGATHDPRRPPPPFFAQCEPVLLANGDVPAHLRPSLRRFANFLHLEHARQLIDRGFHDEAREVLLRHCEVRLDPWRYGKRLARTWPLGRLAFRLGGGTVRTQ